MSIQIPKSTTKLVALIFAVLFSFFAGQIPAAQAAGVNFDKVDTEVRGAIHFGALEECNDRLYTPVRDSQGNLRVIHSAFTNDDLSPMPQHDDAHLGGAISEVAVAGLNNCKYFITATRDASNMLKLISWYSASDGIDRLGDTGNHGPSATEVVLAGLNYPLDNKPSQGYVVAATQAAGGHLVMSTWSVNGGTFNHLVTEIDEPASQIAMTVMPPRPEDAFVYVARIITAFKDGSGNLKVIYWLLDRFGGIHRIADSGNQAGSIQQVAISQYHDNHVITAVKNSDGNLQLIPWEIEEESIDRLEGDGPEFNEPIAGNVQEIDITAINFAHPLFKHVVTAVRTAEGNLRLIAWGIDTAGNIDRQGDSGDLAKSASKIQIKWSQSSQRILTSMRDGEGNLRIIAWRVFP